MDNLHTIHLQLDGIPIVLCMSARQSQHLTATKKTTGIGEFSEVLRLNLLAICCVCALCQVLVLLSLLLSSLLQVLSSALTVTLSL